MSGLDFGNFKLITVTGDVYNDLDGNGLRGSGEPGLAGWTVDLEDSSGNVLATVLTDSNGNYSFTGVGGGSYQVAEVVQTAGCRPSRAIRLFTASPPRAART